MNHRIRIIAVGVAFACAALALTACASGGADAGAIEGTWRLESFGGVDDLRPADPAVTTTLTLADGEASGNGGVNSYGGTYEADGDGSIEFGTINSTLMAGSDAAMTQETEFFGALDSAARFEIVDGDLVLSDTGNNTLVVLAPQ